MNGKRALAPTKCEVRYQGRSRHDANITVCPLMTRPRHLADVGKLSLYLPFHGIDMPFAGNTFKVLITSITEA
jgi:hypothetical protein